MLCRQRELARLVVAVTAVWESGVRGKGEASRILAVVCQKLLPVSRGWELQ